MNMNNEITFEGYLSGDKLETNLNNYIDKKAVILRNQLKEDSKNFKNKNELIYA